MRRLFRNLVQTVLGLLFVIVLVLRFTEGSFEGAGARIDAFLPIAVQEARDLAEEADGVARDIADGRDDETPN